MTRALAATSGSQPVQDCRTLPGTEAFVVPVRTDLRDAVVEAAYSKGWRTALDTLKREFSAGNVWKTATIRGRIAHVYNMVERPGEPHPWYGPCDSMGENDACSECARVALATRTPQDTPK